MKAFSSGVRRCLALLFLSLGALLGCQVLFGDVEISDPPDAPPDLVGAKCPAGEYRCYQETLQLCGEGDAGWISSGSCAISAFCDSRNKRCLVCNAGDFRCNGKRRETCNIDRTDWTLVQECPAANMCSAYQCGPCTPGAFDCQESTLRKCQPNQAWETVVTCSSARVCDATLVLTQTDPNVIKCADPVCDAEARRCEGAELQLCSEDRSAWELHLSCETPELCAKTLAEAGDGPIEKCASPCPENSYLCDGMTLRQCNAARTDYVPVLTCEPGTECNPMEGACTGLCTPGEYQCNGKELRRCLETRMWEVVKTCATEALCNASKKECTEPGCTVAGAFDCDRDKLRRCRDDLTGWEEVATCASAELCNETSKQCDIPVCETPGELRCMSQELVECSPGKDKWIIPRGGTERIICPLGQYCDATSTPPGCKAECPAAKWCNGRVLNKCAPNTPTGVEVASCATDALCQCAATDPDGAGPKTNACASGMLEANGCGKPLCSSNQHDCAGATLRRCTLSRDGWETVRTCDAANLCVPNTPPSAGYCAVCPTAGEVLCTGTAPNAELRTCSSDRQTLALTQDCGEFPCRKSGTAVYCEVCRDGDAQCMGRNLQLCAADRRSFTTEDCGRPELCDRVGKQCDECVASSVDCVGKELQTCSANGQTLTRRACPNICDEAGAQCDVCEPNSARCDTAGTLFRCSADGQMETETACGRRDLCEDGMNPRCHACTAMERRCLNGQPQQCNAMRTAFVNDGPPCVTPDLCNPTTKTCDTPPIGGAGGGAGTGGQPAGGRGGSGGEPEGGATSAGAGGA